MTILTKNFALLKSRVEAHVAADQIVQCAKGYDTRAAELLACDSAADSAQ